MVMFAMSQPEDVDVNEILFRPTKQEYSIDGAAPASRLNLELEEVGGARRGFRGRRADTPAVV
jgi:hypothetical protein